MDYINFDDVFTELQSYRDDNNGSLTVPTSHPSLARIVDNLASGGIEDLAKRRWNFQMAALKDYKEGEFGLLCCLLLEFFWTEVFFDDTSSFYEGN